jgi:multiple sugar transport system permease protein
MTDSPGTTSAKEHNGMISTDHRRARGHVPWHGYAFVAPYVLFLLAFGLGPALYAVWLSVTDTTAPGVRITGLANYSTIWNDFRLADAAGNVLTYMAYCLPTLIVLTLFLALMLHAHPGRFSSSMRMIYYLPGAVTGAAAALVWLFMFSPDVSPFSWLLKGLGLSTRDAVLTNYLPQAIAVMVLMAAVGSWVVIMYGGLNSISVEMLEAATVDGCNRIQLALFIKLPNLTRYIVFIFIVSFAGGTQLFAEPQILWGATQQQVSPVWSLNQLAYSYAFNDDNFGKSAAVSVGLLAVGMVAALLVIFRTSFYRIDAEGS